MPGDDDGRLTVLIASPLEEEHVGRIAASAPARVRVVYDPRLVPTARWPADHIGIPPTLDQESVETWRRYLASADVMFDFDWLEPERLLSNAPRLRWLQASVAGIGGFLSRFGLTDAPVIFTSASGAHAVPLAEHVILGLLYLVKEVPKLRRWQEAHEWRRGISEQLAGRRVLVVGLGHVGREIVRTCRALGLEVWGIDPYASTPPGDLARLVERDGLLGALGEIDALILSCPYTPETHHLIGAAELAAMAPASILVNVSRGAVIDEPELVRALQEGRLSGAVLDVFEQEPLPTDSPLWDMPNVLVSPHSASTVSTENGLITDLFIENLRRYLTHEPLLNVYDPSRGF